MTLRTTLFVALTLCAGCAALDAARDDEVGETRVQEAADTYSACVMREAEKDAKNPAGAEDIAVAAQGRCWPDWDRYRRLTTQTFAARASTREEKQLAADKAEAQIRQVELEARRAAMNRIVERTLTRKSAP